MTEPFSFSQYGILGAIIGALITAIIVLWTAYNRVIKEKDSIQAQRLIDANQTKDKLTQPLEQVIALSQKNYDILQFISDKRKK